MIGTLFFGCHGHLLPWPLLSFDGGDGGGGVCDSWIAKNKHIDIVYYHAAGAAARS